jgi:hypothetical protein
MKDHETLSREVLPAGTTTSFPWEADIGWLRWTVNPGQASRFIGGSTPSPRTSTCGGGQVGKAAGPRCQRFCGFDPRPPHRVAVGKLVKPLGSDPRDFEGSIPSRDTRPCGGTGRHAGLKYQCFGVSVRVRAGPQSKSASEVVLGSALLVDSSGVEPESGRPSQTASTCVALASLHGPVGWFESNPSRLVSS